MNYPRHRISIATLLLAFLLAACGDTNTPGQAADTTASTTEAAQQPLTAETSAATPEDPEAAGPGQPAPPADVASAAPQQKLTAPEAEQLMENYLVILDSFVGTLEQVKTARDVQKAKITMDKLTNEVEALRAKYGEYPEAMLTDEAKARGQVRLALLMQRAQAAVQNIAKNPEAAKELGTYLEQFTGGAMPGGR